MTKEEFKQIAKKLKMSYQRENFFADTETLNSWYDSLKDFGADLVTEVVDEYIKHNKFQPTIADIYAPCEELRAKYKNGLREIYEYTKGVYPCSEDTKEARVTWNMIINSRTWEGRFNKARHFASHTSAYVENAERSGKINDIPTFEEYLNEYRS